MTHHQLSLQDLHGLQGDAHHDDDGSTADGQAVASGAAKGQHDVTGDGGQQGYHSQVDGAEHGQAIDDAGQEVSGGLAGTEAGHEAAGLLEVVGDLHGVELNGVVTLVEHNAMQEGHQARDQAVGVTHLQDGACS